MYWRVAVADIEYLEADRTYCIIHLVDGRKHVLSSPMKDVQEHLSPRQFIRIHRSYIVNIAHITAIMGNIIVMACQVTLNVSKEYRKPVLETFTFIR